MCTIVMINVYHFYKIICNAIEWTIHRMSTTVNCKNGCELPFTRYNALCNILYVLFKCSLFIVHRKADCRGRYFQQTAILSNSQQV